MMEAGPQTYSVRPKAAALFGTGMALTLRDPTCELDAKGSQIKDPTQQAYWGKESDECRKHTLRQIHVRAST